MCHPGYEQENLTKPLDAKAIEAGEPLYKPEDVAESIVVCCGSMCV